VRISRIRMRVNMDDAISHWGSPLLLGVPWLSSAFLLYPRYPLLLSTCFFVYLSHPVCEKEASVNLAGPEAPS
jgi:hypothetical protein